MSGMDWGANKLAPLNYQIISINETRNELDNFDLRSADIDSCVHYRTLQRIYVTQMFDLITMIEEAGDEIRAQLMLMLATS